MNKIRFSAYAPPTFVINALVGGKINVRKVKIGDRKVSFVVDERERGKVEKVCAGRNVNYTADRITGAAHGIKDFLKKAGLIAGLAIGIALAALYSTLVTDIKIDGNQRLSEEFLLDACGIETPAFWRGVSCDKAAAELVALDGVSQATVIKQGSRLYINILEELPESEIIDTQTPQAVIATNDGVITSLNVVQGTPVVKCGDTVRRGDVLIAPYIEDGEGNREPCRAIGEAYAKVWYQSHTVYADVVMRAARTGNAEIKTDVDIFGIKARSDTRFELYESEAVSYIAYGVIPLKYTVTTYYETEYREVLTDFAAIREAKIEEQRQALALTIGEGAETLKWWYLEKRLDKSTQLSIYYETEQSVGGY